MDAVNSANLNSFGAPLQRGRLRLTEKQVSQVECRQRARDAGRCKGKIDREIPEHGSSQHVPVNIVWWGILAHHPAIAVTKPNPPPIFSRLETCSRSEGPVA